MTITAINRVQLGHITTVTVTSGLTPPVYFHWYEDGQWVGKTAATSTASSSREFFVPEGERLHVEVIDTTDADYDYLAAQPGFPARRTVRWIRSLSTDVESYIVSQNVDAGGWEDIATVPAVVGQWEYTYLTGELEDLASYQFRITPVDELENEGSTTDVPAETIVRRPAAPDYDVTFNAGPTTVTFSEAS